MYAWFGRSRGSSRGPEHRKRKKERGTLFVIGADAPRRQAPRSHGRRTPLAILTAAPTGWASWDLRITDGSEDITVLDISLFKNRGAFQLDGEEFTIESFGVFRGPAKLMKGSMVVARAEKTSMLRRRFEISSAGHHLRLESQSWTGRDYALLLGSQEVGRIIRKGFLGRTMELEFADEVPRVLQVFLAFLIQVQAKREAAAASSGT